MSESEISPRMVKPVSPTAVDAVEGESVKGKQHEEGDREHWEAEGYPRAASASSSSGEARPAGEDYHHPHQRGRHEEERKDQGEEEDDGYHEEFEDHDESAPTIIFARSPYTPTNIVREEHEIQHILFRSWCVHFVRSRSIASPHKSKGAEPS